MGSKVTLWRHRSCVVFAGMCTGPGGPQCEECAVQGEKASMAKQAAGGKKD